MPAQANASTLSWKRGEEFLQSWASALRQHQGILHRFSNLYTEEFSEVAYLPQMVGEIGPHLRAWERVYNAVRPHQAFGYWTPLEVVRRRERV
jgi:hypothetical protein